MKDYILRLKTTSIHTAKYAETLSVLYELVKYEIDPNPVTGGQTHDINSILANPNSILAQLREQSNFKFIIKAVQSRDESVISTFLDLIE